MGDTELGNFPSVPTFLVEIELAARFDGIADALCICGDDFAQLEKAGNLLMPSARYLSVPEIFSVNGAKSAAEFVKAIKS